MSTTTPQKKVSPKKSALPKKKSSSRKSRVPNMTLNTGALMPQLGFGTWELTPSQAEEGVYFALKNGYRLIDTARIYNNEEGVGKGIARAIAEGIPRNEIFVVTKLWNADHNDPQEALRQSLARLGLEYVDLYLIHWPVSGSIQTWKQFTELKRKGLARAIGVSNFTIEHLTKLASASKEIPSINQVEFSPFLYQKELLDYCTSKGIVVMSYSPLTRGKLLANPLLTTIAAKYHKTPAQVVLRWHIQTGVIPIPKSKSPARIIENYGLFDFKLTADELAQINALDKGIRYCWNPNDVKWKFVGEASKLFKPKN